MKHMTILLVVACCLMACATTRDKATREAERQRVAAMVADSMAQRTFTVEVDYVTPSRFAPRHLTTTYSVRVEGDSIASFLPYFGRAFRAEPYGRDRSPLDFGSPIADYASQRERRDGYAVRLRTRNGMETLLYHIEVFDNGRAMVHVTSSDRDPISFSGNMVLNETTER